MENENRIPSELRECAQWVNWRLEKGTKPPYRPDGSKASKTNPDDYSTFAEVLKALPRFSGIGFVFTVDDPFCGIDLDGCRNPQTGEVDPWAKHIITSLGSYAEISPSQTGVKIIAIGNSPFDSGINRKLDFPNKHGKVPGIEIYDRAAYFTLTGHRLKGVDTLREVDAEAIRQLVEALPVAKSKSTSASGPLDVIERARRYVATMPPAVSGQSGHNQTFRVACVIVLGFCLTPEQAFPLLTEYNERCEPPWSEKDLRHKLDSANKQRGDRGYLRDAKDDDWHTITVPEYRESGERRSKSDKPIQIAPFRDHVHEYLGTLTDGDSERLYSTGIDELDHRLSGGLGLASINIIGARTGHSKTLLGLQFVYALASQGLTTLIVSEEMTLPKLSKRCVQFVSEIPSDSWSEHVPQITRDIDQHFDKRAGIYVTHRLMHLDRVVDAMRKARTEFGVQVVMIDYLQKLTAFGRTPFDQVTLVSQTLATASRELGLLTLALCQCGREVDRHAKKARGKDIDPTSYIPTKADLRQSGQIEMDADVIIMGFWPRGSLAEYPYPGDYLLRVDKVRDHETNNEPLLCRFDGERMRITESTASVRF